MLAMPGLHGEQAVAKGASEEIAVLQGYLRTSTRTPRTVKTGCMQSRHGRHQLAMCQPRQLALHSLERKVDPTSITRAVEALHWNLAQ